MTDSFDDDRDGTRRGDATGMGSRRSFVAAVGATTAGLLAGCGAGDSGNGGSTPDEYDPSDASINAPALSDFQGSGVFVEGRPAPGGTSMADLPNLKGELKIYLGGGESGFYLDLFDALAEKIYPDFSYTVSSLRSSEAVNRINEEYEADNVQGDVFIAVDAGSLGQVTESGATLSLPKQTVEPVPSAFVEPDRNWVGFEGRARSMPYNTDQYSESDIPEKVAEIPSTDAFSGQIGWAPTYSAFQSFVTAMRLQEGEEATKEWLNGVQELNVSSYPDEFQVSDAVAGGELGFGFANHYYALRVLNARPDAPLELAFTSGDAGALVNISGAAALKNSGNTGLADAFIRHLLSAEAQEFFATVTYGYPMIPEVEPVGGLPTIDELNTPDIDLTKLSDTGPTLDLMRETGVL